VWPVGFEPTRVMSKTVPIPAVCCNFGSFAYLLTTTLLV